MERAPSLFKQVGYGGLVACVALAAGVLLWMYAPQAIAAVTERRPRDVIVYGLICLAALVVPVLALAAFLHWRHRRVPHRQTGPSHQPSLLEDILLGVAVIVVLVLATPATIATYEAGQTALSDGRFGFALGYGLLGVVVVLFALFCLVRYIRWWRA